jgi:hypothetical protein
MARLSSDTFPRPPDMNNKNDPGVLYVRSYLLIRLLVGVIGILLPIALILGEILFIKSGLHVRGSLSAYYHTSMHDLFVGSLCVTGFLLASYMAGQTKTRDFWFSLVAGLAVLIVVFFPTWRDGLTNGAPLCGSTPTPEGCSAIQQEFGEAAVANIHSVAAAIFILSLAAISFLFAHREEKYNNSLSWARFHRTCGVVILAAVAWVVIGGAFKLNIWEITPLYLGEVISVWAFGASWFAKGKDLWGDFGFANLRRQSSVVRP